MVEPGLKNISHGRGKRERPNLGLPAALSGNHLPKATKGRGQPSAALSLGSVYLCTAKSPGGGCSLGPGAQHQPAFQRHRWALAFLTAQCDPDIRAAGKWDFARIEFGKNHFRKKNKTNNLLNTHWSRGVSSLFRPKQGLTQARESSLLQNWHGRGTGN